MQPKECSEIAKYARKKGYNIWAYTGYTYEQLLTLAKTRGEIMDFLKEIDVLVDGKFELAKKNYQAIFRGSYNQRIIDVASSLKEKKVVLVEKYNTNKKTTNRERQSGIYI